MLTSGTSPLLVAIIARGCGPEEGSSRPRESFSARTVFAPIITASARERRLRIVRRSTSLPRGAALPPTAALPSTEATMLIIT